MKKVYLLAAVMAVITAFAVYYFASSVSGSAQKVPNVTVVAAKTAIAENTLITEPMLQLVTIPSTAVSGSMVKNMKDAVGKVCPYPIGAKEYLYSDKLKSLGADTSDGGLAYSLEKGMRAVTVRVDDISGIGYYIKKGDYVDVVATAKDPLNDKKVNTGVILENVKIIAVGNQSAAAVSEYTTLTVAVNQQDAVKLVHAIVNAKVNMILRPTGDDRIQYPRIVSILVTE